MTMIFINIIAKEMTTVIHCIHEALLMLMMRNERKKEKESLEIGDKEGLSLCGGLRGTIFMR